MTLICGRVNFFSGPHLVFLIMTNVELPMFSHFKVMLGIIKFENVRLQLLQSNARA